MNKTELAGPLLLPPPGGVLPETWSAYKSAKNEPIEGDYDVFGDGTVVILRRPGTHAGASGLETQICKKAAPSFFPAIFIICEPIDFSSGAGCTTRIAADTLGLR